ncbi:MAG: preprotein translocase subunit SecG [Phycisphaerae bacterium]
MNGLILSEGSIGQYLLAAAAILVALMLIGLIMLQKNKGSGLSGAFGGVGGHSAFGTKTGDFMTWLTVALAVVFLSLNIAGVFVFDRSVKPPTQQTTATTDDKGAPADQPSSSTDKSEASTSQPTN